jgi:hypothetical protein
MGNFRPAKWGIFRIFRNFGASGPETILGWIVLSFGSDGTSPEPFAIPFAEPGHFGLGPYRARCGQIPFDGPCSAAVCPICDEVSRSRHSCYCRCLQDFPWQGVSVQLWATVGRFRCRNSSCPRGIFCERLPLIARVYGRQTDRASEIVRLIGYVAGGRPGQRLLDRLSLVTSRRYCAAARAAEARSGPCRASGSQHGFRRLGLAKKPRVWNDSCQLGRAPRC